ncbi:hypothetical protein RCG23_16660 [Neobacillus sp. PS3-34]|uniref:hypothetical protein n=1 Tax=Neobacillus sp. PS3-34 TaxID=3070678 RepID=UPI0027E06846|nr:hypothetical protein [Neobacillus sp. PS3-34]WML47183.1 hypothetical protein RCG23_16660 [Neobacillus sp. PS3-34]
MDQACRSKRTKGASALVSPDRHKTNHAVILGKAIAFPSCDADAAEAFLVLISGVIWLMTPSCSKHHLKVMLGARNSKGLFKGENWLGAPRKSYRYFFVRSICCRSFPCGARLIQLVEVIHII